MSHSLDFVKTVVWSGQVKNIVCGLSVKLKTYTVSLWEYCMFWNIFRWQQNLFGTM